MSELDSPVTLTGIQSLIVGILGGASSSLVSHPFQVLRARFQHHHACLQADPKSKPPSIFPKSVKILFRGFSATLINMWSLAITQSFAQNFFSSREATQEYSGLLGSLVGGMTSSIFTTPLEGVLLRQSKTKNVVDGEKKSKNIYLEALHFYKQYGLKRLYAGGTAIAARTAIVGSGFSLWTPYWRNQLEDQGFSPSVSLLASAMVVSTAFAALSQPPDTIRIEQQYVANEKHTLTMFGAARALYKSHGVAGLMKGISYRVPRTAVAIFINALVYTGLEDYFQTQNAVSRLKPN